MTSYILIGLVLMGIVGAVAFVHPQRAFQRSAIAAVAAIALPFVLAYTLAPFLGDGAGMGVALILYVCSAVVLLAAVAASLGAAAHHVWKAMRR
jgi:hypothetical protein